MGLYSSRDSRLAGRRKGNPCSHTPLSPSESSDLFPSGKHKQVHVARLGVIQVGGRPSQLRPFYQFLAFNAHQNHGHGAGREAHFDPSRGFRWAAPRKRSSPSSGIPHHEENPSASPSGKSLYCEDWEDAASKMDPMTPLLPLTAERSSSPLPYLAGIWADCSRRLARNLSLWRGSVFTRSPDGDIHLFVLSIRESGRMGSRGTQLK
jgi:hypothetical protein